MVDSAADMLFGKVDKETSSVEKLGRTLAKDVVGKSVTQLITKGSVDATSIIKDVKNKGIDGIVNIGMKGVKTFIGDIFGLNKKKNLDTAKKKKQENPINETMDELEKKKRDAIKDYQEYVYNAENTSGEQKLMYERAAENQLNLIRDIESDQSRVMKTKEIMNKTIAANREEIDGIKREYNITDDSKAYEKFTALKQEKDDKVKLQNDLAANKDLIDRFKSSDAYQTLKDSNADVS